MPAGGEVGQGVAVGAVCLPEQARARWSGELGGAGDEDMLGQPGEEQGDAQAVFGDLIGARSASANAEAVTAGMSPVTDAVSHLPRASGSRGFPWPLASRPEPSSSARGC
jgi:hypothetical protein